MTIREILSRTMSDDSAVTEVAVAGEDGRVAPAPRAKRIVGGPVPDPTPATQRLYAGDWAHFVTWCRQTGHASLPASSATMSAYLLAMAPDLSRGTLGRRRAAIGTIHRQANLPVPLLGRETQKALLKSARPKARNQAAPTLGVANLRRMAGQCPRDLPGIRDRALLLLVAALTRPGDSTTEVAEERVPRLFVLGLDAEHIRFTASGMTLQLRTRTDEQDPSRTMMVTRGFTADGCSVRALEDWLRASETAFGPVFRKVDRWGNVEHGRLGPDAWYRIIAQRAVSPRGRSDARKKSG